MSLLRTVITGTGSYLPEEVVPGHVVEERHGFAPGFASDRLGIPERRRAGPGELSWHMGAVAGRRALERAGVGPDDLDLVLFHATYTEMSYPTPGAFLQRALGIEGTVPVLEVRAACASFLAATQMADGLLRAGSAKRVLVVCAERAFEPAQMDRATAPLFGDGAGAAVLEARDGDAGLRWIGTWMNGDGALACCATSPIYDLQRSDRPAPPELEPVRDAWRDREPEIPGILTHWNGPKVFRNAVRSMGAALKAAAEAAETTLEEVDHFVVHQANGKILASLLRQYRLPAERTPSNIHRTGNTSSATVPILLDDGFRSGLFASGDVIAMTAFGAGFVWSSAIYRV